LGVAVTPDGTKVYVTNYYENNVSVIDTTTNNFIAMVNVGRGPLGVAVTPDGKDVYVANNGEGSNTVSVINTTNNTAYDTVNVGSAPIAFGQFIGSAPINLSSVTVHVVQSPSLNITKSANPSTYNFAGESITYTYNVTNTGNVNLLGDLTVTDDYISGPITIFSDDLSPGTSVTGTGTYSVTQQDLNNGSVTNFAYSTTTNGPQSNTTTATITAVQGPAPIINIISPTSGSVGTLVTLIGTGFTGATAVNFGSNIGTNLTVVSDTEITVNAPAGTGTVDVTVTTPVGTSGTFTYNAVTPVASFTEDQTSGTSPLAVQFYDTSSNVPTSWLWEFGDGSSSTMQNPEISVILPMCSEYLLAAAMLLSWISCS